MVADYNNLILIILCFTSLFFCVVVEHVNELYNEKIYLTNNFVVIMHQQGILLNTIPDHKMF